MDPHGAPPAEPLAGPAQPDAGQGQDVAGADQGPVRLGRGVRGRGDGALAARARGLYGSAYASSPTTNRYVTRSRGGMRTSAYQQSVSRQRRRGTGADQLSKTMLAARGPRRRNRVVHPSPSGIDRGVVRPSQKASVPGTAVSPNAAKASAPAHLMNVPLWSGNPED